MPSIGCKMPTKLAEGEDKGRGGKGKHSSGRVWVGCCDSTFIHPGEALVALEGVTDGCILVPSHDW